MLAVLGLAACGGWTAGLPLSVHLRGSDLAEAGLDAMVGVDVSESPRTRLASGVGTSLVVLPDGRAFVSAQPLVPASASLAGGILGGGDGGGFLLGWFVGQILSNSEVQFGNRRVSVWGGHRLDLLVPGLHPAERLSLGLQAGNQIAVRLGGQRSISSIEKLDGWAIEGRLVFTVQ